jgi:hypothetical protein
MTFDWHSEFDQNGYYQKLMGNHPGLSHMKEDIVVQKASHFDQTDLTVLNPIECQLASKRIPFTNSGELLQMHTWLWLRYLHG